MDDQAYKNELERELILNMEAIETRLRTPILHTPREIKYPNMAYPFGKRQQRVRTRNTDGEENKADPVRHSGISGPAGGLRSRNNNMRTLFTLGETNERVRRQLNYTGEQEEESNRRAAAARRSRRVVPPQPGPSGSENQERRVPTRRSLRLSRTPVVDYSEEQRRQQDPDRSTRRYFSNKPRI